MINSHGIKNCYNSTFIIKRVHYAKAATFFLLENIFVSTKPQN